MLEDVKPIDIEWKQTEVSYWIPKNNNIPSMATHKCMCKFKYSCIYGLNELRFYLFSKFCESRFTNKTSRTYMASIE